MRQTRTRILSLLLALVMCLGLLPVTALAAGEIKSNTGYIIVDNPESVDQSPTVYEGVTDVGIEITSGETYNVTFDANGGQFPDGSTTMTVQTKWLGAGNNITTTPQDPTREGYTFDGWDIDFVWNHDFTADTTVKAKWEKKPEMLITLDPNGGRFEDGSTAVKNVPLDSITLGGPIPTVSRFGFTFDGWYMNYESPSNLGVKMENWSFTGSNRLTAVWIPEDAERQEPIRIDFIPNGGTITSIRGIPAKDITPGYPLAVEHDIFVDANSGIGMMMTDEFGNLDSFPVIERNGYTLDGWYIVDGNIVNDAYAGKEIDIPASAKKVSLSTVFKNGGYLAAKWVKAAETFTVTFDLNGATGTAPAPQKVEKGKTVELPVLRASNAEFLGWGYSTDGKTLVEWKAEYPVTSNLTLYAMWDVETGNILKGLTYRFGNNRPAFRYSESYEIPQIRYEMVLGKTQGEWIYKYCGRGWGGNCYGMAATSGMFFHGNGSTTTASFRSGAEVPYDLSVTDRNSSLNMSLTEYIEAVFVSQYARVIQDDYGTTANLNDLAKSVKAVQATKSPVMIAVRGETISKEGKSVDSGHAVLGYDVVDVNSTESRLMIYDPNFPNTERYITLTKSGNHYVSWAYKMNDKYDWGTGRTYENISAVPYSDYSQAWNNRAVHGNDPALFSTSAINASILDGTGKIVATIKDGTVSTSNSDITPILTYGVTSDGTIPVSSGSCMWLPAGQYTIQTSDSSGKELEATLADVNQSATVSTAAKSVTFVINDNKALNYVQIDQAGAKYDITLSSTLDQGHESVQLAGTTASGGVSLAQISGSLYATGINSGAVLKVDGKSAATSTLSNNMPDIGNLPIGTEKPTGTNPFTDVKSGAYYYDAVLWAVTQKITSGTSATTFSPNNPCTRGQIVTFLWRAAGSPKPTSSSNPFIDVKAGAYYYDAVLWAVEKGITSGTSATTFSPNTACTRGQTVTFLWRAAGSPEAASSTNPFSDVKSGAYYYDAVLWAVEQKVTSGTSATTFAPGSTVTRGQTVTFLWRSRGK